MIKKFWRLSIKQTFENGALLSDWDMIFERFQSLHDLVAWFYDFCDEKPSIGDDCIMRAVKNGIVTEGKAFFLQEDDADMEDYSKLIEKGELKKI